jgi:hypothetical protein
MAASPKPQVYSSSERRLFGDLREQLLLIAASHQATCAKALYEVYMRLQMGNHEDIPVCLVPARESVLFGYHFEALIREASDAVTAALNQLSGEPSIQMNRHYREPEWIKQQLTHVIDDQRALVESWIKHLDEQFREGSGWRAPRWLSICVRQPDGNIFYDRLAAWERENESRTKKILGALVHRFISSVTNSLRSPAQANEGRSLPELVQRGETVDALRQQLKRVKNMYRNNAWSATQIRHKTKQECAVLWEWIDRIPEDRRAIFLDITEWEDGDKFIYLQIATLFEHSGRFGRLRSWSTIRDWRKEYTRYKRGKTRAGSSEIIAPVPSF